MVFMAVLHEENSMQHKCGEHAVILLDAHAWGALCRAQVFQGSTEWETVNILLIYPYESGKSLSYSVEKIGVAPPHSTHTDSLLLQSKKHSSVYFSLTWWMSLMLYLHSVVALDRLRSTFSVSLQDLFKSLHCTRVLIWYALFSEHFCESK